MASQGPNSCGTGVNNAAAGIRAWNNPTNIYTSDNTRATTSAVTNTTSQYLDCTNFGFSIPSGATIDGIVVEFERYSDLNNASSFTKDSEIKIIKGGTMQTTNKADTVTKWVTPEAYFTYGSSSDLWGTTWTDSDINASNFGVSLRVSLAKIGKGNINAGVDHVRITVYYTSGGGGPTSASALLLAGD